MKSFCVGDQKYVGITFKYEFFTRTPPMLRFGQCGKSKFFKKPIFPKSILRMSSYQDEFLRQEMIVWMYLKVLQTQKIVVSDSDDFEIPTKNEIFFN